MLHGDEVELPLLLKIEVCRDITLPFRQLRVIFQEVTRLDDVVDGSATVRLRLSDNVDSFSGTSTLE